MTQSVIYEYYFTTRLDQGRDMEELFYKHIPRLSMMQFYHGIGRIAFKGHQIRIWNWHLVNNVIYYKEWQSPTDVTFVDFSYPY